MGILKETKITESLRELGVKAVLKAYALRDAQFFKLQPIIFFFFIFLDYDSQLD